MEILLTICYVSVAVFMLKGATKHSSYRPVAWWIGAGLFSMLWPFILVYSTWETIRTK